jgi:2-oxoisovalerate dehydrogenase E2 component (dihydrolipoyl transacylase)
MKYVLKTPDLGEGTTQAEIVEWRVKVGDFVREDQPIADLMTDKATVEVSSPVHGTIVALRGAPGETMAVGAELVVFDVAGDEAIEEGAKRDGAPSAAPQRDRGPPPAQANPGGAPPPAASSSVRAASSLSLQSPQAIATRTSGERPIASPAVRRRAAELGIALAFVPGAGPGGRIGQDDLDAFIAAKGATASDGANHAQRDDGFEEIKIIGLRRKIAERMQDAKRRIPHIAYVEELDVTAVEDLRRHLNEQYGASRTKLSLLPFLMRAMIKSIAKFPQVNAHFDDAAGVVRRRRAIHIGIATQTPAGLTVPVVRHAEALDIWACAREVARLAQAAREAKASREELTGSTITISSLGALGGIVSTPVINSPEVAIVGVNKIVERPVVIGGQIVVRKMMNLSSSFDHRIIDGWDAASFIQEVKIGMEQPALLFMQEPR